MANKAKTTTQPDWLVKLEGCRVGRAKTYKQAKSMAEELAKQHPQFVFEIAQDKPSPAS